MTDAPVRHTGAPADVFDWDLAPITMADAVGTLRAPSDDVRMVMTVNAATMRMASLDPALARVVEDAYLRVTDGMGVVWSWRILGRRLPERIAGIDLMEQLVRAAASDGRSIYLLGAEQEVLDRLTAVLCAESPGLRIAGSRHGFFGEADYPEVIGDIKASDADILFIGMPSPFKELWAADHLDEFGCDLVLGVGGSFDVLAGFISRAPRILQRLGLEWAWRLACEPRRMWKRYTLTNAWLAKKVVTTLMTQGRSRNT